MHTFNAIGLMSGSSLDGVDVVAVFFAYENGRWYHSANAAECYPYPNEWKERLIASRDLDGLSLWQLHSDLGHYYGKIIADFIAKNHLENTIVIGSHGHTIFHFPENKMTCQIGDGAAIAYETGIDTVCDLRSADIAAGGQGAPIVPIGDRYLFEEYNMLLNIGGIANISVKYDYKIFGFDICMANQLLNYYAQSLGKIYDESGAIAKSGTVCYPLLEALSEIKFLQLPFPKSMDNGCKNEYLQISEKYDIPVADKLRTLIEHIALQIATDIEKIEVKTKQKFTEKEKILTTGGGAWNTFLIEKINEKITPEIIVPDAITVNFKEAIVMAFIAVLRILNKENVLASVTGAAENTVNGAIYYGKKSHIVKQF